MLFCMTARKTHNKALNVGVEGTPRPKNRTTGFDVVGQQCDDSPASFDSDESPATP